MTEKTHTTERLRDEVITTARQLRNLLDAAQPTPDQWQAIESYAFEIVIAARKGRSASFLVRSAQEAQALRLQRYTDALDADIRGQLHPIFANIIKAAGMQ